MRTRLRLASGLLTVVATATLGLTGCGAGDGGGTDTGTSDDPEAARLAYAKCMREHGVDVPDPKPGGNGMIQLAPGTGPGGGVDAETFDSAQQACAKYAEDMGGPGVAGLGEADKERMLKFARCMRDQGIDVPDPDFGEKGEVAVEVPLGSADDPDFQAAHEACQRYFGPAGDGS